MTADLNLRARARLGTTLRGKYTLERVLGAGGMAVVYKALHRNRAEFAVKMLLPELSHDEEVRTRFLREGYAANSVKHPGVVAIVDDDVADDGAAFIVMELLDGLSVEDLAQKHGGRVPPKIASAIGCQVLEVIAAAHDKGILHRDLKPANLFLVRSGQVKVLDFGIARVRDLASKGVHATQTGTSFGTPAFMSPEQARGKTKEIDERSDVWAIGATLFALLTGLVVHEGESSNEIMVKAATEPARRVGSLVAVPPAIGAIVDRALAFAPSQRFASASAMCEALVSAHVESFGAPPSHADLAAFLDRTPHATVPGLMVGTKRVVVDDGATTAIPVATEGPKTRSRGVLVAAISAGAVMLIGLAAAAYARETTNAPTRTPLTTTVVATSSAPAALAASTPVPPPVTTTTTTIATVTITTTATHRIIAPPKPSATVAKPDCNPSYTLDKNGEKHFKPECF